MRDDRITGGKDWMDSEKISLVKQFWLEYKYKTYKPRSIVLKLGTNCNLRCDYCYVEHKVNDQGLSIDTVEKLFDELMINNNSIIDCCFHGGEPFFYFDKMKAIVTILSSKPYAGQIRYSCQSNGTLLTDEAIDFIKKFKVSIGISIDGPKKVNDLLRKFSNGRGSFNKIVQGMKKLQENNIDFSVLSVLTNDNIDYVIETLVFLKSIGISNVDFKPCFKTSLSDNGLEPKKYADYMIKVIEWLLVNNSIESPILIRELEMYTNLIMKKSNLLDSNDCRSMCDMLNCGAGRDHITIDTDGSVYICDRLYGHKEYIMGNIREKKINNILKSELIRKFLSRKISEIDECCDCEFNSICFLGCPATNILQSGGNIDAINQKPEYCEYFKRVITRLSEIVKNSCYQKLIIKKERV